MLFIENSYYAWMFIGLALVAICIASFVLAEIKYFLVAFVLAGAGILFSAGLYAYDKIIFAQIVPWVILLYILVDVLLPLLLAPLNLHWFESEHDRNVRISHENAAQYPKNIIPFPGKEAS